MSNAIKIYSILGVNVNVLSREQFVSHIDTRISNNIKTIVYTPYSEFIYKAQIDKSFLNILNSSDINIADGVFIQIASLYYELVKKTKIVVINYVKIIFLILKMIFKKVDRSIIFPELLSGSNEIITLCKYASEKKYSVYLAGGIQNVVYLAAQNLRQQFPDLIINGVQSGRAFSIDDNKLIKDINNVKPQFLFICFGAQKQERWINTYKDKIDAKVIIGLGGTFDYLSGKRKMESQWWADRGLKWLHRLLSEPVRWKRQIIIFKLLWILAKS